LDSVVPGDINDQRILREADTKGPLSCISAAQVPFSCCYPILGS